MKNILQGKKVARLQYQTLQLQWEEDGVKSMFCIRHHLRKFYAPKKN